MAEGKLTALKVTRFKEPGYYGDGSGLYLQVTRNAGVASREKINKSWIYRYWAQVPRKSDGMVRGLTREMGLGPYPAISLADARERALECRRQRAFGLDPIEQRRAARERLATERAKAVTFKQAAERYVSSKRDGWRNEKHAAQWTATLESYANPILGHLPVQAIDTSLVLKVLEPIWTKIPETAVRVRGRIEAVLDAAAVRGERRGENPARWKGHLSAHLPQRSKVRKVKNHPALPYDALGAFLADLREVQGIGARALEFTILTAARSGETRGATWAEIDGKLWTVPAERMKGGREHRIPLSGRALAILEEMALLRDRDGDGFLFPAADPRKPLSDMTLAAVIRRMNDSAATGGRPKWIDPRQGKEVVPHGFRSTFRDWAAERTNFPRDLVEAALAHTIDDKTEAANRRGDMFDKRRRLMEAWAEFAAKVPNGNGAVVPMSAPA